MKRLFFFFFVTLFIVGGLINFTLTNPGEFSYTATIANTISSVVTSLTPPKKPTTKLFFVGDMMLSRSVGARMVSEDNYLWPFIHIAPYFKNADIIFGNLENPISERGKNVGSIYSFRAHPRAVKALHLAGFDAVSVANNHIGDWTREAALDTFYLLEEAGILPVGGGINKTQAHTARTISRNDTTFGFLGYTLVGPPYIRATDEKPGITTPKRELMFEDISRAQTTSDVVIVSLHFGEEYEPEANTHQKDLARNLIDAGANLVIGHHPHVHQPGEYYKDGYIAYSLGNFIFDQHFSEETSTSVILEISMQGTEIVDVKETPIRITTDSQVILEDL